MAAASKLTAGNALAMLARSAGNLGRGLRVKKVNPTPEALGRAVQVARDAQRSVDALWAELGLKRPEPHELFSLPD
jgi:hypothetical protein